MKRRIGTYKDKILVEGAGTKLNKYEIAVEDLDNKEGGGENNNGGSEQDLIYSTATNTEITAFESIIGFGVVSIAYTKNGNVVGIASPLTDGWDQIAAVCVDLNLKIKNELTEFKAVTLKEVIVQAGFSVEEIRAAADLTEEEYYNLV